MTDTKESSNARRLEINPENNDLVHVENNINPCVFTPKATKSLDSPKISRESFLLGPVLGEGSYGTVRIATFRQTGEIYAIKIMDKEFIRRENQRNSVMNERDALSKSNHPLILKLHYSFQDKYFLYIVVDYCSRGDLSSLIKKLQSPLPYNYIKFYLGEIILSLEYLHHTLDMIHRDIKPENILIHSSGHIKLTDFATVLVNQQANSYRKRSNTFCGTAQYVAPELLKEEAIGPASDLWSLGVLAFFMYTQSYPFKGDNEFLIFQSILDYSPVTNPITFSDDIDHNFKDLILKLLQPDQTIRIGYDPLTRNSSFQPFYNHSFFQDVNLKELINSIPPYLPAERVFSERELSNDFDDEVDDLLIDPSASPLIILDSNSFEFIEPSPLVQTFLEPNEYCILEEKIIKKQFLLAKNRILVLTTKPRILVIDPSCDSITKTILFTSPLLTQIMSQSSFDLSTETRTYHYTQCSNSKIWKENIDKINMKLYKTIPV